MAFLFQRNVLEGFFLLKFIDSHPLHKQNSNETESFGNFEST